MNIDGKCRRKFPCERGFLEPEGSTWLHLTFPRHLISRIEAAAAVSGCGFEETVRTFFRLRQARLMMHCGDPNAAPMDNSRGSMRWRN
jgi:hypothetical protein